MVPPGALSTVQTTTKPNLGVLRGNMSFRTKYSVGPSPRPAEDPPLPFCRSEQGRIAANSSLRNKATNVKPSVPIKQQKIYVSCKTEFQNRILQICQTELGMKTKSPFQKPRQASHLEKKSCCKDVELKCAAPLCAIFRKILQFWLIEMGVRTKSDPPMNKTAKRARC